MKASTVPCRWLIASLALLPLAACALRGGNALPTTSYTSIALPNGSPSKCKGQKRTKKYASDVEVLSSKGGVLCVPVFGGFSGAVPYAAANPSVKVTLITSTTNYNGKLPQLGRGTPLVYGQYVFGAGTKFAKKASGDATFTAMKITPGKAYTLFGQFIVNGKKMNRKPCYAVATKGKYGGVFDAGPGIENSSIQPKTTIIGELYSGMQTSTPCS